MSEKVKCRGCGGAVSWEVAELSGGLCLPCQRYGSPEPTVIVSRSRETPPRCIALFHPRAASKFLTQVDAQTGAECDRVDYARYQLLCSCEAENWTIHGYWATDPIDPEQVIFLAPFVLACTQCASSHDLFDPRVDGYNAEIGVLDGLIGQGQSDRFACPECGGDAFAIAALLAYRLQDEEMEDWDDLTERPQDFFTTLELLGKCANCGEISAIADCECA